MMENQIDSDQESGSFEGSWEDQDMFEPEDLEDGESASFASATDSETLDERKPPYLFEPDVGETESAVQLQGSGPGDLDTAFSRLWRLGAESLDKW